MREKSGIVVLGFAMAALILCVAGGFYVHNLSLQNTNELIRRIRGTQEKRDYSNALNTLGVEILNILEGVNGQNTAIYQARINSEILNAGRYQCSNSNPTPHVINNLNITLTCQTVANPSPGAFPEPYAFILKAYESLAAVVNLPNPVSTVYIRNPSSPGVPPQNTLVFVQQPSNVPINTVIAPAITVEARAPNGNLVNINAFIKISLGVNPGGGVLSGTSTGPMVNGHVTFNNLTIDKVGQNYTLVASSLLLTPGVSNPFNVTGPCEFSFVNVGCGFSAGGIGAGVFGSVYFPLSFVCTFRSCNLSWLKCTSLFGPKIRVDPPFPGTISTCLSLFRADSCTVSLCEIACGPYCP